MCLCAKRRFLWTKKMIQYFPYPSQVKPVFSILVPSWNNLPYLQTLVASIRKNSRYAHQIVVHVNQSNDGTLEWVRAEGLSHTYSTENAGVCYGFNAPSALATADYLVLIDDDMYVCPDWDYFLMQEIDKQADIYWCISGTMIEPTDRGNPASLTPYDYGTHPEAFEEARFLAEYEQIPFADWSGSSWYPLVLHRYVWNAVGGLSVELTPGMYSDPDFMLKLYHAGVRTFYGIERSRVYHFQSRSTGRVVKNNGRRQFLLKWEMASSTLFKHILKMGEPFGAVIPKTLAEVRAANTKDKWKLRLELFKKG